MLRLTSVYYIQTSGEVRGRQECNAICDVCKHPIPKARIHYGGMYLIEKIYRIRGLCDNVIFVVNLGC